MKSGAKAFDFNGWVEEQELLRVNADATKSLTGTGTYDLIPIESDLETFCEKLNHRLPRDFHRDPSTRAAKYISKLLGPREGRGSDL